MAPGNSAGGRRSRQRAFEKPLGLGRIADAAIEQQLRDDGGSVEIPSEPLHGDRIVRQQMPNLGDALHKNSPIGVRELEIYSIAALWPSISLSSAI